MAMEIEKKSILAAITGIDDSAQLVIPIYQRTYCWGEKQCKELWSDVLRVQQSRLANKYKFISHFLGSVVLTDGQVSKGKYYVVDGQQRLLTITLLLKAAMDHVKNQNLHVEPESSPDVIQGAYLYKTIDKDTKRLRICPNLGDEVAYKDVLLNRKTKAEPYNHHFAENYSWFYSHMQELFDQPGFTLAGLLGILKHFDVTQMRLTDSDDAQRIFETINATGISLNNSDKIRNFVLMGLDPSKQRDLWTHYWQPIERNASVLNVDNTSSIDIFLRTFLAMKLKREVNKGILYDEFKAWWNKQKDSGFSDAQKPGCSGVEGLFCELADNAEIFGYFVKNQLPQGVPPEAKRVLDRLIRLKDLQVESIFLMPAYAYLRAHNQLGQLAPLLETMESYTLRAMVAGQSSNVLTTLYIPLPGAIAKCMEETRVSYLQAYQRLLIEGGKRLRFVSDEYFEKALHDLNVYNSKLRKYILSMLLNGKKLEGESFASIYQRMGSQQAGAYTIEHVMPQKLNNLWKQDLGPNWNRVHEQLVHCLGNLTLTAYNQELSNNSFLEKQKILANSPLSINAFFKNVSRWGEEEINRRTSELVQQAMMLWPSPQPGPMAPYSYDEDVTASEVKDFTDSAIKAFTLCGQRTECPEGTWAQFLTRFLSRLPAVRTDALQLLADHKPTRISRNPDKFRAPKELTDGFWCAPQLSANDHVKFAKDCLRLLDIPLDELILHIHVDKNNNQSDSSNSQEEEEYYDDDEPGGLFNDLPGAYSSK